MTRNSKALFYSALVFPGSGQFFLRRYKSAALFISLSVVAFIYIAIVLVEKANVIVGRIVAGEVSPEYSVIRKLLLEQQNNGDSNLMTIATYLLVAIWLLSIIDVVRLKKYEPLNKE